MVIYDPRNLSWDEWCSYMAELFAPQQLGTVTEDKWVDWAIGMIGIGYFTNSGVPDPRGFTDWRDWAERMVGVMTIKGRN